MTPIHIGIMGPEYPGGDRGGAGPGPVNGFQWILMDLDGSGWIWMDLD